MNQNQNPKKQLRNYIVFSGVAIQMGLTIYLSVLLGKWLDEEISYEKRYFTILFTFIGLVTSIFMVVSQLKKIDDK